MKKWIFILIVQMGFSALPPLAQGIREMQAILADSRFYGSLGSAEVVKELIRTEKGYLVLTQHYAMQVEIQYGSNHGRLGPVQFELEFQQPVDLRTGQVKS